MILALDIYLVYHLILLNSGHWWKARPFSANRLRHLEFPFQRCCRYNTRRRIGWRKTRTFPVGLLREWDSVAQLFPEGRTTGLLAPQELVELAIAVSRCDQKCVPSCVRGVWRRCSRRPAPCWLPFSRRTCTPTQQGKKRSLKTNQKMEADNRHQRWQQPSWNFS